MKRMKFGFTLAEVMITLGIIGVIAAMVMPAVMTNYTYKTVGVKLSKFMSQLEGSTRPYVVQNTVFRDAADAQDYISESFLIKNLEDLEDQDGNLTGIVAAAVPGFEAGTKELLENDSDIIRLKDGTEFQAYMLGDDYEEDAEIDTRKVGEAVWGIAFAPRVNGLPRAVNKSYQFVITELGYVYPDRVNDECTSLIYDEEFLTNARTFREDGACVDYTAGAAPQTPPTPAN